MKKKLPSILLTLCMVVALLPAVALAVDQPVLTGNSVYRDTAATATVRFASDTAGAYYYQVTDSATVPAAASIVENGTSGTAAVGTNSISITGMTTGAKYVYITVKNADVYSDVLTVEMPYDVYFFDDFEAYAANTTVPTSYSGIMSTTPQFYLKYNGSGDANQKVLSETQTDGTTGGVLQMVGKEGWAADCRANIAVPSGGYLVYEVDAKPVAGNSPVGMLVGNPSASTWVGAAARLEMSNNAYKYGVYDRTYDIAGSTSYTNGSWYHLKFILDKENHKQDLYCNGVMINRSPLDAGNFEPNFLALIAGNSGSNTAYFDNVKLYTTTTDPDPDKIYTYTYNAPSAITKNSVTAAVSYDKDSPQPEGASITATVTLSGTATAAGTHTVGLASAADITGGVAAPSTVTKTVTANQVMTASDTFAFTFTMPAANVDDLVLTHIFAEALTGTVDITGTEKYGSELIATVTGSNNTGTLSYQWKRGTTDIGTNSNNYTLAEADIGQTITCEATSSVQNGTISDSTGTIGKADGPVSPAGLGGVKPDSVSANGKITGTTAAMEYSTSADFSTAADCTATETAVAPGTYYVRVKATTTTNAGASATVTVPNADTPAATEYTVTFNANGGTGTDPTQADTAEGGTFTLPANPYDKTGYTFSGWNDGTTTYNAGETYTMPASAVVFTAQWAKNSSGGSSSGGSSSHDTIYDMIKGTNAAWTSNATTGLSFTCSGSFSKFLNIKVDGSTVSASNYTAVSGSTVVTLKPEYLKTLSSGTHTLRFEYTDGYAKTSFVVSESEHTNPQTGVDFDFTDVSEADWFYNDVAYVFEKGLMNGTSSTTFSPNMATTRGMIVTVLYRQAGSPTISSNCPFNDVKSGMYYETPITWAAANGIVNGYSADKFGADDPITREQMAAILYRYAQYKGVDVSAKANLSKYKDAAKVSDWAKDSIAWTVQEGILNGVGDNLLSPETQATRAQIAAILHRFCENISK